MSRACCKWHNKLPETYEDTELGYDECGLAGMGRPIVCCRNCSRVQWFYDRYKMKPEDIDFVKEIMALPIEERL